MRILLLATIIYYLFVRVGFCQIEISQQIQDLLEELVNESDEESEIMAIYEHLEDVQENPFEINIVSQEQLESLYILTDFQVYTLIEYREKYGRILSLQELNFVMGFNKNLIDILSMFLQAEGTKAQETNKNSVHYSKLKIQDRYVISYPKKKAFQEDSDSLNKFNGRNFSHLIKIRYDYEQKISCGMTMENDVGEAFDFNINKKGFDFYSAYLQYTPAQKTIKNIIMGDYRLSSGLGLIHGYGFSSKTSETILKQSFLSLKKYSSSAEYGFYRGLAINLSSDKLESIFYASGKNESAILKTDQDSLQYFNTIDKSGLHRNLLEEKHKNTVNRQNAGFILSRKYNTSSISYNVDITRFNYPFQYRNLPDRYSITNRDKSFFNQSISYKSLLSKLFLSGEVALDKNHHLAFQQIINANLHPLFTISLAYRYYSPQYISWLSKSLAESSPLKNEEAIYLGIETYPFRFLILNAYIDNYKFPWIRYSASSPYSGTDILLSGKWIVNSSFYIKTLMKNECSHIKEFNEINRIPRMEAIKNSRFSIQTNYNYTDLISFKNKIEIKASHSEHDTQKGYLLYQEINKKFFNEHLSLNLRYTLFDIPNWSVRIYSWEHDLLYGFSVPVYYKSGQNILVNLRYSGSKLKLGLKTSISVYNNEYSSGNGVDERNGRIYSTWKFQWVYTI